jgi:hypothetical protein
MHHIAAKNVLMGGAGFWVAQDPIFVRGRELGNALFCPVGCLDGRNRFPGAIWAVRLAQRERRRGVRITTGVPLYVRLATSRSRRTRWRRFSRRAIATLTLL